MYQFFVENEQIDLNREQVHITGSDVNHIKNVLRMKAGEMVRISNQQGRDDLAQVAKLSDQEVLLDIVSYDVASTELPSKIYLFLGIPKGERMETVIEKAVELGVYEIIPVAMKYCVVRLDEKKAAKKTARWQEIARSAAKQSKRSIIPKVHDVMSFAEAVAYANSSDVRLVPYENEAGMTATKEALQTIKTGDSISVFIGPEGGISDAEIEVLRQDAKVLSLGKRILRTDTAAISAMTMLMLYLEMLGGSAQGDGCESSFANA